MEPDKNTTQVADSERGELIEGMVLDLIHRNNVTKVRDLVAGLQKLDKFLTSEEIHEALRRLETRGEVTLSEETLRGPFLRNLADFEANAPFWTAIITSALVLAAILALPEDGIWTGARTIVGAVFLFVMPGYVLTNALIARNRLSLVERLALSVGLSLAVVSMIGVVLAYGMGIRLEPPIAALSAFVVSLAFVAAYRSYAARRRARQLLIRFLHDHVADR